MASPVSFGDVVAMAKIAKTIAQAFTKGRRSAPAEFREVENQLYSLSAALAAFQDVAQKSSADLSSLSISQQNGDQTLSDMLGNCSETLQHLETIVKKYGLVAEQQDPTKSRLHRWSQELLKNYKKIAWTTEAGDLATLRSQLMIHTNSLDLVLGIVINSRTTRIEDSLKQNTDKLAEIHAWWEQNLKNSTVQPAQAVAVPASRTIVFEVRVETENGAQLLCPESSLREDWKDTGSPQLFECLCRQSDGGRRGPEHWRVQKLGLSPISFPFRNVGDTRTWTIFKVIDHSSNKLLSITIRNMPAGDIAEFEDSFVRSLSEQRAASMLNQGVSNMLVHLSPAGDKVRILDLKGDLGTMHKSLDTATFGVGHRSLVKSDVTGLSLLHYRELTRGVDRHDESGMEHAEVLIHYDGGSMGSITRSELRLKRNTSIKLDDDSKVVVNDVECLGFAGDDEKNRMTMSHVTFQMTTGDSAQELFKKLEAMRMELFVQSLQHRRSGERVALHLQVTQVQCEKVFVTDAEMLIMRNQEGKFRLVILSRNRCTVLSQELPERFFAETNASEKGSSTFGSLTWLVQLEGQGERKVYRYPNGFKFLNLHSAHAERMFELGRIAVSQTTPMIPGTEDDSE